VSDKDGNRAYHHGDLRSALIAAAEAELSEAGMEGFSLRACARRAGVSHTAPKHHFGNADGLLAAVAAAGFRRLTEVMRDRAAGAAPGRDGLVAAGCGYVAFADRNPTLFKLMFSQWARKQDDRDLRTAQAAAFDLLRRAMPRTDPSAEPEAAAPGLLTAWAVVHGLSHLLIEGATALVELGDDEARSALIAHVLSRVADQVG